jgi:hypothetical protein
MKKCPEEPLNIQCMEAFGESSNYRIIYCAIKELSDSRIKQLSVKIEYKKYTHDMHEEHLKRSLW